MYVFFHDEKLDMEDPHSQTNRNIIPESGHPIFHSGLQAGFTPELDIGY